MPTSVYCQTMAIIRIVFRAQTMFLVLVIACMNYSVLTCFYVDISLPGPCKLCYLQEGTFYTTFLLSIHKFVCVVIPALLILVFWGKFPNILLDALSPVPTQTCRNNGKVRQKLKKYMPLADYLLSEAQDCVSEPSTSLHAKWLGLFKPAWHNKQQAWGTLFFLTFRFFSLSPSQIRSWVKQLIFYSRCVYEFYGSSSVK